MSLMRFFQIIDKSFIGQAVAKRMLLLSTTNPDRIYVENVRSFFNIPFSTAKLLCNMAVKENLFQKKIGLICPNYDCERIIMSVDSYEDIPLVISCDNCEVLENEKFEFTREEIKTIEYYRLNRLQYA